jgi:hypothetical protein
VRTQVIKSQREAVSPNSKLETSASNVRSEFSELAHESDRVQVQKQRQRRVDCLPLSRLALSWFARVGAWGHLALP